MIDILYKRLKDAGFSETYVKEHGFPDWWDDSCADDIGLLIEAKLHLIRNLGIEFSSMWNDDEPIKLRSDHFLTE